jgi:hypothetical protein
MMYPPIPPAVAPAFDGHGDRTAAALLRLRRLILDTAAGLPQVGELAETLKWGQPSYVPARRRIGSSVRLGVVSAQRVALYFICHTHLVDRFREQYGNILEFGGNRAILLDLDGEWPVGEIRHCIAMALTWHLGRR